ncbi:hypothetical protein EDC04DRAFT_2905830 [Pisolithus marmoratus]|nr:hypothetical protein EDC04DRAFT_2905830 [Pisolithus marmoratus]
MPPKGSKGKSKSSETKAKSGEGSKKQVEDMLLMDQTEQKTLKLEETIEQLNLKNEKIKNAMIGYVTLDITALMESFQVNAVDRFNPAHAIPLIMPRNLIKRGTYTTEVSSKTTIPILQVRDDAPHNWNLPAAGGQHCVAALEIWLEKKRAQLNEYIAKEWSIQKQDPDDMDKNELKQWNEGGKKEKDALEGIMAYEGVWLVSLFDDSMIDKSLALHISRNETKHVYMESPMEGLIQLFKIMKAQGSDYWQVKLVPQSKGNTSKQRELLRQDYVWEMLTQFDTAGMHYWHADFMQFSEFYSTMMSSYGGMLAYLVGCLEKKLRMCFNSVEVDEKAVKTLLLSLQSKKAEATQEKLEQIFDDLRDATPIPEVISNGIREAIDECFNGCIANMSGIHEIGNQSSADWATIFAQYASEVPCKIEEQVTILQEWGDLDRLCTEVRHALKTCMIKSKIVFMHLARIQSTIFEISSWWTPYIYAAKIHPKEWNPGSASADMRRAVLAHPDYHVDSRNLLWDKIVLILFESYPAALHMEGQILAMNIPDRSISQSELLSIFGMSLTGAVKKSKPSIPRKGKAKAKANDNDDNDGEYINVDGESSAEKDVDGEGDNDDEQSVQDSADDKKHAVQVESREERLARRERAKMEAEEHAKSLEIEASQAFKVLNNSPKVSVPAVVPLYLPWTCKSKISSDAIQNSFRGQDLLKWHTWEWAAQVGPLCMRNLQILGCITIYEACSISAYRLALLSDMNGGAATLCSKIELETTDYRVNRVSKELQQTTLLEKRKRPNKVVVTHTWPDGLTNDQPVMKVFDLDTELSHHNYTILWESQWGQLQRVINCVETQHIAWDDTTNTVSIRDRPPLAPNVQQALEDLVKELNMNAYVQRCGLQVGDSDQKKRRSGIDMLEVVYRATEEGASKMFSQKCKFVITSHYDLEMSKVGTLNPADSTSVPDASEPYHAEPAGTERSTIRDASTTHQSSENRYNILTGATGAEADHPSSNNNTQDCLMGNQETGKYEQATEERRKFTLLQFNIPTETSGGKGDDVMDNAGDMSMDKSLEMGSNSSDASSDSVSGPSTIHQSADNQFEILADADADAPSGNPNARDDPLGNDSMDHAGDASLEMAVDKESGVSDVSSHSASPLPHFGILSPPATAYSPPLDPPPLHNSDDDMFLRTMSSETQCSRQTSAQPSRKRPTSKSLSSGDELREPPISSRQALPSFKQKLDGASPSSKLVNVAEADEDVGDQLG